MGSWGPYDIRVATSLSEAAAHRDAWQELTDRALEDNVFLSPGFVLPALHHLRPGGPLLMAFVYRRGRTGEQLVACAPFSYVPPSWRWPLGGLSTLSCAHLQQVNPLLDRDYAPAALRALWSWLDAQGLPPLLFEQIGSDTPTWALCRAELEARGRASWVQEVRVRPMLRRHASFAAYLAALPASRRQGYRRRRRDLERLGPVEVVLHRDLAAAPDLADRFMALERLGWKGAAGSALRERPDEAAFFRAVTAALAARRRLFFVELRVGGQTAAMTANFVQGRTLFAFKIAHDPALGACSPGTLVELEGIRLLHEDPVLVAADSCSSASAYVRAYYRESRELLRVWVATPPRPARWLVGLQPLLRALRHPEAAVERVLS